MGNTCVSYVAYVVKPLGIDRSQIDGNRGCLYLVGVGAFENGVDHTAKLLGVLDVLLCGGMCGVNACGSGCLINVVFAFRAAKLFDEIPNCFGVKHLHHVANEDDMGIRAVLFANVFHKIAQSLNVVCGGIVVVGIVGIGVDHHHVCLAGKCVLGCLGAEGACVLIAVCDTGVALDDALTRKSHYGVVSPQRVGDQIRICQRCILRGVCAVVVANHAPTTADAVANELNEEILCGGCGVCNGTGEVDVFQFNVCQRVAGSFYKSYGVRSFGNVFQNDRRSTLGFVVIALAVLVDRAVHVSAEVAALHATTHFGGCVDLKGHVTTKGCGKFNTRCAPVAGDVVCGGFHTGIEQLNPGCGVVERKLGTADRGGGIGIACGIGFGVGCRIGCRIGRAIGCGGGACGGVCAVGTACECGDQHNCHQKKRK